MKHAFLIIAHKQDYTLETLLELLDHNDNDIFIHMDAKNDLFDADYLKSILKHSKLFIVPRTKVTWGGFSQIRAEIILMKTASEMNHYDYYHLLSGEDLPIKSMDTIHKFFNNNIGKEFIQIEKAFPTDNDRILYRHYFQELCGKRSTAVQKCLYLIQKLSVKIQKVFHITRNNDIVLYRGTNWFSLTEECVQFALHNREWIEKKFKYCYCGDELFLQTLLWNNGYQSKLFDSKTEFDGRVIYGKAFRLQDWSRGKPYVWEYENYEEIISDPENLFARKFDAKADSKIISEIKKFVLNSSSLLQEE